MRYECILRYGVNSGHEYRFATVRRENGAVKECDRMVATTVENMTDHANGGRVVQGAHPTDPNATVVVLMLPDGTTSYKTVTYRATDRENTTDDTLGDALLASLVALGAGSI
jgi:hypothetical protein